MPPGSKHWEYNSSEEKTSSHSSCIPSVYFLEAPERDQGLATAAGTCVPRTPSRAHSYLLRGLGKGTQLPLPCHSLYLGSLCPQVGEGNGNPLQYSCRENPMDRRAWWAAICRVTQSWTRLKQLSSISSCPQVTNSRGPSVSCLRMTGKQSPVDTI